MAIHFFQSKLSHNGKNSTSGAKFSPTSRKKSSFSQFPKRSPKKNLIRRLISTFHKKSNDFHSMSTDSQAKRTSLQSLSLKNSPLHQNSISRMNSNDSSKIQEAKQQLNAVRTSYPTSATTSPVKLKRTQSLSADEVGLNETSLDFAELNVTDSNDSGLLSNSSSLMKSGVSLEEDASESVAEIFDNNKSTSSSIESALNSPPQRRRRARHQRVHSYAFSPAAESKEHPRQNVSKKTQNVEIQTESSLSICLKCSTSLENTTSRSAAMSPQALLPGAKTASTRQQNHEVSMMTTDSCHSRYLVNNSTESNCTPDFRKQLHGTLSSPALHYSGEEMRISPLLQHHITGLSYTSEHQEMQTNNKESQLSQPSRNNRRPAANTPLRQHNYRIIAHNSKKKRRKTRKRSVRRGISSSSHNKENYQALSEQLHSNNNNYYRKKSLHSIPQQKAITPTIDEMRQLSSVTTSSRSKGLSKIREKNLLRRLVPSRRNNNRKQQKRSSAEMYQEIQSRCNSHNPIPILSLRV